MLTAALASCRGPELAGPEHLASNPYHVPQAVTLDRFEASMESSGMATTVPLIPPGQTPVTTWPPWQPQPPGAAASDLDNMAFASDTPALKPVVPRTGGLFTASDIDSIMGGFGQSGPPESSTFNLSYTIGRDVVSQNFQDVADDFYKSHGIDVPVKASPADDARDALAAPAGGSKCRDDFKVPERKALREQINAIDSWLEDDFAAREQISGHGVYTGSSRPGVDCLGAPIVSATPSAGLAAGPASDGSVGEIFHKLEEAKRAKVLGQKMSPVTLKKIAQQAAPIFPGLPLDKLVHALRLFTSARCEDHDLYLRILGEIPVQIRGITPDMLITCVRVLWRLRLHEETYLELFSMEAMNMIRSKRRPAPRAPRRAPALRTADIAAASNALAPTPPAAPAPEATSPFDNEQLVHLGNALSRLGAKHPTRFMDIYQEQLALAIPRLTQEECELVCPSLAMSQLMHDPLRRAFLERCAQVEAGKPSLAVEGAVAPDIAQYQLEADRRRRRAKHFRNIYVIEASVRKETFAFFTSLPGEVQIYLDRIHTDAAQLDHEGTTAFSAQVAAVLDQLGLCCDTQRLAGPLGLHVVARVHANPRAEVQEIVYECSDASFFYRVHHDDRNAVPELTAWAKNRQRLLQRMGVQLTHINIWEWQQMSEAQRINYMVKVQSLQ